MFGAVLIVLYFSQACSYIHFHHSHLDHVSLDETDRHHLVLDSDFASDDHEGDHHHCAIDQHDDHWYRTCHNTSTGPLKYFHVGSALAVQYTSEDHSVGRLSETPTAQPNLTFYMLPSLPRSPPSLG